MSAPRAEFVERTTDGVAALTLGAAVLWTSAMLGAGREWLFAAALAAVALAWATLRRIRPAEPRYALAEFVPPPPLTFETFDELLLTDFAPAANELVLDDPIPPPKADSRVVRLFAAQPPELAARTHHDRSGVDATAALLEALADLRHSLR